MMKNKNKILLFLSVILALTLAFTVLASADFGDFGGDSDFGGGGGGSDSSWDFGGSSSGGGFYINTSSDFVEWFVFSIISLIFCLLFISKSKSATSSGAKYFYRFLAIFFGICANILAIIFIKGIINSINGNTSKTTYTPEYQPAPAEISGNYLSIEQLKSKDKYFTENNIKEFISNFYIKHQNCKMTGDYSLISPYCTEDFFKSISASKEKTNIVNPTVLNTTVLGYKTDGTYDSLFVRIYARQKQPNEVFINLLYTLKRSSMVNTKDPGELTRIVCPNCGAPVDEAFSSKCSYCDSIIDIDPEGWKISACNRVSDYGSSTGTSSSKISVNDYLASHTDVDVNQLKENISSLYISMQEDWGKRNIMPLQKYFTDVYFKQMNLQVQGHINAGRYPHCENISVDSVEPLYFTENSGSTGLTVRIVATITAYYTDSSGKIISGNKNRKTMTYEWDLIKKTDSAVSSVKYCPGCGAEISGSAGEFCSYCGSVIRKLPEDWAISSIRAVSQVTK